MGWVGIGKWQIDAAAMTAGGHYGFKVFLILTNKTMSLAGGEAA